MSTHLGDHIVISHTINEEWHRQLDSILSFCLIRPQGRPGIKRYTKDSEDSNQACCIQVINSGAQVRARTLTTVKGSSDL